MNEIKGCKLPVMKYVSHKDVMYSIGNTVNSIVITRMMCNKQDRGKQRLCAIKILNHSCTTEWASLMAWQCRRHKKHGFNSVLRKSPGVGNGNWL